MPPVPTRLKKEPLVEVIWRVGFADTTVGELLPGILFTALQKQHPHLRMQRLPPADIPAPVRQADSKLRQAMLLRLESDDDPLIWQIGDRALTLNCRRPYVGWDRFSSHILNLISIIEDSGVVSAPEDHSLRYLDLLTLHQPPSLQALRMHLTLADQELNHNNLQMRVEITDQEHHHVLQIVTPARISSDDTEELSGTLVDLETKPSTDPSNWDELRSQLDPLHTCSKAFFFDKALSQSALKALEPEYLS